MKKLLLALLLLPTPALADWTMDPFKTPITSFNNIPGSSIVEIDINTIIYTRRNSDGWIVDATFWMRSNTILDEATNTWSPDPDNPYAYKKYYFNCLAETARVIKPDPHPDPNKHWVTVDVDPTFIWWNLYQYMCKPW